MDVLKRIDEIMRKQHLNDYQLSKLSRSVYFYHIQYEEAKHHSIHCHTGIYLRFF